MLQVHLFFSKGNNTILNIFCIDKGLYKLDYSNFCREKNIFSSSISLWLKEFVFPDYDDIYYLYNSKNSMDKPKGLFSDYK